MNDTHDDDDDAADEPGADAPAAGSKRFFKLAGMTASVAATYAKSRLKSAFQSAADKAIVRAKSHQETGERIAKTLGELKGAAMKIGQMASIQADVLPKELSGALSRLQKEAPPMAYEVIAAQIELELGSRPEKLFQYFDRSPFAAASIGQVHRARSDDGREVVVKVQYPGVDASVDSDLTHLKLALRASGLIRTSKQNIDALFKEISARLHEELDYTNEADNVRMFRAFHAKHPFVVIPQVIGERSSQRVLTLTYEPGDNLAALDAKNYSPETRDLIGRHLFEVTLGQLFEQRAIHADPNPANYAFRDDGSIVIYDFGCVKKLTPQIVRDYAKTLLSAIAEDYAGVDRGLIALGARRPDHPPLAPEFYKTWRDTLLIPFTATGEFDYGASKIHEEVMALIPSSLKYLPAFYAPVELIFIDRVMGGHYGNLRKLRARGRFFELIRPWVERAAERTD